MTRMHATTTACPSGQRPGVPGRAVVPRLHPVPRGGWLYIVDDVFTALGVPAGPNLFLALSLFIVAALPT
ncbi:hypothetical protein QJS66_12435 [Kocuria rhizophila]|nr:hypothetical protein QJS66_12435 [Kocuria rhizophila]